MSKPISFLDALAERYGSEDTTEYEANAFLVGFGGRNAKNNKKWEMVGMEKTRKQQSQHGRLQTIVLKDAMVAVPEATAGEIKEAQLSRATEVDLSGNFELSVADIEVIVASVPNLQLLQLNRIPLLLTAAERANMQARLIAEGRIEIVPKVGAKDATAVEMVAKVIPALPSAFLNAPPAAESDAAPVPIPGIGSRLLTATWPNITQLVLNGTGLTSLLPLRGLTLARCEEIHLDMNNISALFPSSEVTDGGASSSLRSQFAGLANVKIVSLALNQLATWAGDSGLHLLRVHAFPKLTSLFVGGNPLPNLPLRELEALPAATEATDADVDECAPMAHLRALLANLVALDISDCAAADDYVTTLAALARFAPAVAALRVSYEALFADKKLFPTESIARNLTIASLPGLATLNRAAVRPKERVDAELYYVQRAVSEMPELRAQRFAVEAAAADSGALPAPATAAEVAAMTFAELTAGFPSSSADEKDNEEGSAEALIAKAVAAYPRYFELRQLYRHVIISQQRGGGAGDGSGAGGNGFMIDVTIRADAFADQHKRLPASLTIQKAKALAAALFSGLDASQMELSFWVTAGRGDNVAIPLVLDNDMQSLGFYGVPSGATLKIRDLREKQFVRKQ